VISIAASNQARTKLPQFQQYFGSVPTRLIDHDKNRLGKNLHAAQGAGEPVRIYESPTDFAEAQWMVEEMKQLLREGQNGDGTQGVAHRHEIAVLYRSNAQSRVIETALFNAAMPYRVYGGLRFFERAEIKHALAYLRLCEKPAATTPASMRDRQFSTARHWCAQCGAIARCGRRLWAAHCTMPLAPLTGKAGASWPAFVAMIDVLREQTPRHEPSAQIIELVLDQTGLIEHYQSRAKKAQTASKTWTELVNAAGELCHPRRLWPRCRSHCPSRWRPDQCQIHGEA
jgi:DNA helicase-2/ATP-dependent DNA helicase PcrA